MTEEANINPDKTPQLDPERKEKIFAIAKLLKKSCYSLSVAYQEEWLVVCSAIIDGTLYESANAIDAFDAKDHADIFRMAFSEALKEVEQKNKSIITIH